MGVSAVETFLSGFFEPETPTSIVLMIRLGFTRVWNHANVNGIVWNKAELFKLKIFECVDHLAVGVDAVGIEYDHWFANRNREKEISSGSENPNQFLHGPLIAHGVQLITIATQPDVLHHMHAGQ